MPGERVGLAAIPLVIVGGVATTGVAALGLWYRAASDAVVPRWQASQYWLAYSDGFVRRGLPGEVLATLVGGVPSYPQMAAFALTITAGAVVAVVALIAMVCRSVGSPAAAWALGGVLVTSPFTLSLVAWDVGRYDGVGVIVLAGVATWGRSGSIRTVTPGLLALSGGLAAAAACEEFLILYLVPVAIVAVRARFAGHPGRLRATAGPIGIVVVPALIVVVRSVLIEPQRSTVYEAIRQGQDAGVQITDRFGTNALVALLQSPGDAVALAARVSATNQVLCLLGCAASVVGTIWLVWRWSERRVQRSGRLVLGGYCALAAGMGLVGVDYRRWWGLALMSLLGCLAIVLARGPRTPNRVVRVFPGLVAVIMLLSVAGQLMPVHPSWDPAFGRKQPPLIVVIDRLFTLAG